MRKLILIFSLILIFGIALQSNAEVLRGYAHESITVANTAIGFTAATMKPASGERPDKIVFVIETAQMRYTLDGTAPTTALGLLGEIGDIVVIEGEANANAFQAIRTGGTSAVIQPQYFSR